MLVDISGKYRTCSICASGTYSAARSIICSSCPAGYYSASAGSSSCTICSTGYFSTTGATSCTATLHDFDFRGCITGAAVTDAFSLSATPYNGPTCSSYGMYFDGVDDYLVLTNWNWGGATSFEVFVKFQSFSQTWSRIFDFGSGLSSDNVILTHPETFSEAVSSGKNPKCAYISFYKCLHFLVVNN